MTPRLLTGIPDPQAQRHGIDPRRPLLAAVIGTAVALAAAIGPVQAQTTDQQARQTGEPSVTRQVQTQISIPLPSLSPLVEAVNPAVANVSVVMNEQDIAQAQSDGEPGGSPFPRSPFEDFLRRFFEAPGARRAPGNQSPRPQPRPGQAVALGSGFIIDADGDVVTNNHVVGTSDNVTVVLPDSSKHRARIVGRDEQTDIALLKIDSNRPIPHVDWGDSDAAKVGDWVVAVGNPFGLGGTVTAGIISARGRNIQAGPYDDFLQIDAPINRGNSGGPTFNLHGQVIGINTAIYSPSGGSVGIGFAVPSSLAKDVVAQLKDHGYVSRGWLGVQVQSITPEIARSLGLDPNNPKGALVAHVEPGSPAAKAGLKEGDVIVRFNDKEINELHDLPRLVAETPPGQQVQLAVLRKGKQQQIAATVGDSRDQSRAGSTGGGRGDQLRPRRSSALGLELSPLSDETRDQMGVPADVTGVVVIDVAPDSAAAGLVQPGDVIISINQQPVTDPGDAADRLNDAAANKQGLLLLNHEGANRFVGLPL
ncbi:MAG TPA: DegQ family serine endoprotease [Stellaceae bacterium]